MRGGNVREQFRTPRRTPHDSASTFRHVGRRLALLNAIAVILVIALSGIATFLLLRQSLDEEVNDGLRDRVEAVRDHPEQWGVPSHDDDDDDEDHDREIVDSGDTLVFVVDRNGELLANTRGVDIAGLPDASSIEQALTGERDTRTVSIADDVRMRVMSVPLRDDGRVVGAVQAARSLREHETELALVRWMTLAGVGLGALVAVPAGLLLARRAMRPIDAAFQRQRAFVADASHELRTPLTLVRANAEMVMLDPDRPVAEATPALENILTEVDRTDRLVDDLLLLARMDAGQLALDMNPADPGLAAAEAAESMRPLFVAGGVQLRIERTDVHPIPVDVDRIQQLVRILLDNALNHSANGDEVTLQAGPTNGAAQIVVRDTGVGIAPEHLAHVFERFYRADSSRTRQTGGTGLGLSIARAIVEAHGGQISIDSQPKQGTVVTVILGN